MIAFVTGATGFVGPHLVDRLLELGYQVRCLIAAPTDRGVLQKMPVECLEGDLCDPQLVPRLTQSLRNVDVVFHLAGLTRAPTADRFMQVNAFGVESVVRACAEQASPPVLIHISSLAAAGPVAHGKVRTAEDPPCPVSDYGRSKLAGERTVRKFAARVPATIVRPGMVFGPHDRASLSIFQSIRRFRCHVVPGRPSPPLSLMHVQDLVEVCCLLASQGERLPPQDERSDGCYFACDEEHPSYAELGLILRGLLNRPFAPVISVPYTLAWSLAWLCERHAAWSGRLAAYNRDKLREASSGSWACCPAALRRDLNFRPRYPLRQRLQQTVEWYRQAGWL